MRDENFIAVNEMIDYVVGPMPAKDFLEYLSLDSRSRRHHLARLEIS